MHGTPFHFVAAIGIPDAGQCLVFAAPFLAVTAGWWAISHTDQIVDRLFPHWEWEKRLGWLNIRAQRQADAILRWMSYGLYAVLAVALAGIVWGAQALPFITQLDNPDVLAGLTLRLSALLVGLGLWLVYLGCGLIPKLRRQYEEEELEKFRAEHDALEQEQALLKAERAKSLPKPRFDLPARSRRMGR